MTVDDLRLSIGSLALYPRCEAAAAAMEVSEEVVLEDKDGAKPLLWPSEMSSTEFGSGDKDSG